MLASSVVFLPRLRGTSAKALLPLREWAYRGESEVLVPISSTNTSRLGSTFWATITLQALLSHSSLSLAPTDLFSCVAKTFDRPADGGGAHSLAKQLEEVVGSLFVAERRSGAQIIFE